MIKLRILRWRENSVLTKWAQWSDHNGPYQKEAGFCHTLIPNSSVAQSLEREAWSAAIHGVA